VDETDEDVVKSNADDERHGFDVLRLTLEKPWER
jgi:hypothetical protein